MSDYDKLFNEVLSLSPGARAMLAEHLLESLDPENQKEIDKLWSQESEKRVHELKEGKLQTIPGKEVFQKLRSKAK
ncbi:MAG: addiction module protein [Planctomycetota bacterium]